MAAQTSALTAPNEIERLNALDEYGIFGTPPEDDLDRLVDLAARLFGAPYAALSLVGHDQLYFKSRHGMDLEGIAREGSFCEHAVRQNDLFLVPDAREDDRFCEHPIVSGPPNLRFYAGVPLLAPSRHKIGTFCILDDKPRREFSDFDRKNLEDIAALVMSRLERRRLSGASNTSKSQFHGVAEISPDAIVCTDTTGKITFWNPAASSLFGYSEREVVSRPFSTLFPRQISEHQAEKIADLTCQGEQLGAVGSLQLLIEHREGRLFPVDLSLTRCRKDSELCICMVLRDVANVAEREQTLFGLVDIDALTGAYTHSRLSTKLKEAIECGGGAVLAIDFDAFKDVNDQYGYATGDRVLRDAVKRLGDAAGPNAIIGRTGGDSFAIVLPGVDAQEQAAKSANAIRLALAEPITAANRSVRLTASVGSTLFPTHGTDPHRLIGDANLALRYASDEGGNRYKSFDPTLRALTPIRRISESELRGALDRGEFQIYYQPQVRLSDKAITGAEALLRWRHPDRGLLPPAAFLPELQASALASPVGDWLLRTACAAAASWQTRGHPEFKVCINPFDVQFRCSHFADKVREALLSTGLSPKAFELEITEDIALNNNDAMIEMLQGLRNDGIGISFDDYGTGYASLSALKQFPITRLKIDRDFVRDLCEDKGGSAIIQAIIYIGRKLGLSIIAEGIETEAQAAILKMYGCTEGQGFLFSPPLSADELTAYLARARQASPATKICQPALDRRDPTNKKETGPSSKAGTR